MLMKRNARKIAIAKGNRINLFQRSYFRKHKTRRLTSAWSGTLTPKSYFLYIDRACPTNRSDCGSLRSHNL